MTLVLIVKPSNLARLNPKETGQKVFRYISLCFKKKTVASWRRFFSSARACSGGSKGFHYRRGVGFCWLFVGLFLVFVGVCWVFGWSFVAFCWFVLGWSLVLVVFSLVLFMFFARFLLASHGSSVLPGFWKASQEPLGRPFLEKLVRYVSCKLEKKNV